jgi:Glycosyl hydrolase catalytic core
MLAHSSVFKECSMIQAGAARAQRRLSKGVAAWALVAAAALIPAWALAAPLVNPGFEGDYTPVNSGKASITGVVAPGWYDNSAYGDVTVNYSRDTTHPHSGSSCQKVELKAVASGAFEFQQQVRAKAGRLYTPGVWLRGKPGTRVNLWLAQDGPPYGVYEDAPAYLTDEWQFVSVPAHATKDRKLVFKIFATQPTTFCIDDAAFPDEAGAVTPEIAVSKPKPANFGMHINNYLASKGPFNLDFEGSFKPVNSPRSAITGQVAQSWFDNSDWAEVTADYSVNNSSPHSGTQAQRIVVSNIASGLIQTAQFAHLRKGETYTASVWLRGTPGMQLSFSIRQWEAPFPEYGSTDVVANGAWQKVSVTGQMTGEGISVLMVRAFTTGTLDIDDTRLLDATGQPADLALPWPQTAFGTWRLWDQQGTSWAALEPQKGQWDYSLLDKAVADAQANNAQIVFVLGQSPTWASARPTEFSLYGAGAAAEPKDNQDWIDYLRNVATRYKGKILLYEMWNEPNDPTYFSGSVAKAVELTQLARDTLKAVDPRIKLISSAPYSVGYLQQYLAAGAGQYADIIGYHIYNTPPEDDIRLLADLRTVKEKAGVAGKPLWITEGATGDTTTPVADAAGLLARKYLVEMLYGSSRFNWYVWGAATPFCLATSNADQTEATAAGVALGALQGWLVGGTIQATDVDPRQNWTVQMRTPDGLPGTIVWNPRGTANWPVPAGFVPKEIRDLAGNTRPATGSTRIAVGPEPVLIVGQ